MSTKTYVVTGGTDGIGKALAHTLLERGHEVTVVGRSAEKGARWRDFAQRSGAKDRARFIRADLALASETQATLDTIRATHTRLDALVLCARHFRSTRLSTPEGLESTFAHFYLSRFLLSHGLTDLLDSADAPVILNVAGPGGGGEISWDDLQLTRSYDGGRALAQGGRLNDLLAAGFAAVHPDSKIRYVLLNPGTVSTSFSGSYAPDVLAQVEAMRRSAPPIAEALPYLLRHVDTPQGPSFTAYDRTAQLPTDTPDFHGADAHHLHTLTESLLPTLR
ncbi:SDR family NAD(P)-dependent oxidoreductase [Streptomyces kanamyceticus]|uniref:SDR family NAD(P)-dependent oxidoreductase n=1 Tax=Streptomyces kanamyceticus TaxID=1967 RepID=A0A5J6GHX0_STRKN|nr:SDR family NAD(P)-dependent oxidoreductase [Streptomyces kanamyceticus]QEU94012.1 SDR family NAD(P)-dependent oxidoreductase [Streptomyces kanamyceticus]